MMINDGRRETIKLSCKCCGKGDASNNLKRKILWLQDCFPKLEITCCYRCPKHNKEVGGAKNSLHMMTWGERMVIHLPQLVLLGFSDAIDCYVPGIDLQDLAKTMIEIGFGGVIVYPTHVHGDVRAGRRYIRGVKP